nr:hypothetical protein [Ferrimicrobium acidiphilum]
MDQGTFRLDIIGFVIGLVLIESVLVAGSSPNDPFKGRLRAFMVSAMLWLGSFLLLLTPIQILTNPIQHFGTTIWILLVGSALLVCMAVTLRFSLGLLHDHMHGPYTTLLLASWIIWGFIDVVLAARIYPFVSVVALVVGALMTFGLLFAIVDRIGTIKSRVFLRASITVVAASLIVGLVAAFIGHSNTLQIDLGPNQQPTLATASSGAPGILKIRNLKEGLLTSGLGLSDKVLRLNFHGFLRVSKPNFHQLVTLTIHGRFGASRAQQLLFRARGVPQPGGSLAVVASKLTLHSQTPAVNAQGHADAVLADAIFGTLQLHHHTYTYLLTYEPTGLYILTGTIDLWPQSAAIGHAALE